MRYIINYLSIIGLALTLNQQVFAETAADNIPASQSEYEDWEEWDTTTEETISWGYYHNFELYYSNTGLLINLAGNAIPDINEGSESRIYLDLFKRSGLPQYVLFEFSIYPMPILGVYTRENHATFYEDMDMEKFNLIESVTAGFEEPFAFSVFFNNMVTYGAKGDLENSNRGFMGYLLSIGNYHIQRNRLLSTNWMEVEWKIKGDILKEKEKLSWSFRLGGKFFDHKEIVDYYYIVLKRSQISSTKPIFSWLFNTGIEFTYSVNQTNFNSVGFQVFFEKKMPIKLGNSVFSLGLGLIHESNKKYLGELREAQAEDKQTFLVLRPSFEF